MVSVLCCVEKVNLLGGLFYLLFLSRIFLIMSVLYYDVKVFNLYKSVGSSFLREVGKFEEKLLFINVMIVLFITFLSGSCHK